MCNPMCRPNVCYNTISLMECIWRDCLRKSIEKRRQKKNAQMKNREQNIQLKVERKACNLPQPKWKKQLTITIVTLLTTCEWRTNRMWSHKQLVLLQVCNLQKCSMNSTNEIVNEHTPKWSLKHKRYIESGRKKTNEQKKISLDTWPLVRTLLWYGDYFGPSMILCFGCYLSKKR